MATKQPAKIQTNDSLYSLPENQIGSEPSLLPQNLLFAVHAGGVKAVIGNGQARTRTFSDLVFDLKRAH